MRQQIPFRLILVILVAAACGGPGDTGQVTVEDGSAPPSTGIQLTLTAPAEARDFKVGIDGGAIGGAPRVVMVAAEGATTATVTVAVPPGGPYRVRAIARRAGIGNDAPGWATGKVTEVSVQDGELTDVALSVEPYSVEITVPDMVTRGERFTVRWRYDDPGDVLEDGGRLGMPAGAVHYSLSGVRDGRGERAPATGVRLGEGEYELTATLVAPLADPDDLHFQVVGYTFGNLVQPVPISFFDPSSARGEDAGTIGIL